MGCASAIIHRTSREESTGWIVGGDVGTSCFWWKMREVEDKCVGGGDDGSICKSDFNGSGDNLFVCVGVAIDI